MGLFWVISLFSKTRRTCRDVRWLPSYQAVSGPGKGYILHVPQLGRLDVRLSLYSEEQHLRILTYCVFHCHILSKYSASGTLVFSTITGELYTLHSLERYNVYSSVYFITYTINTSEDHNALIYTH